MGPSTQKRTFRVSRLYFLHRCAREAGGAGIAPVTTALGQRQENFMLGPKKTGGDSQRISSRLTSSRILRLAISSASFHGYRSPSWPRSYKHNMQKRFCLSTFAATVTTTLVRTAFEARFDLSLIICRKKPKNFPETRTSTCTALDHAKSRAPVWRICCGNRDLAHLWLLVAWLPGVEPAIRSSEYRPAT